MSRETGESYNPKNDALPEPEGGYTREYIEEALKKWEIEITDMEVKRDALKLMIEEGKQPKRKQEFKNDIDDFNRKIKVKQNIIEKGKMALKEEIKTGKYE